MQTFVIDTATAGNNTIVPGVAGRRIKLTSLLLNVAGTVTVQWFSGTTKLSGPLTYLEGDGYTLSFAPPASGGMEPQGYLITNAGDPLILALGGAVQVSGHATCTLETA